MGRPLRLGVLIGAVAVVATSAHAQTYPTRTIEVVVPYAPGGSTDVIGRILAQKLQERFARSIVILNRPGASGEVGIALVSRASPDGYTLLHSYTAETVVFPQIAKGVKYSLDDFEPIAITGIVPLVMIVAKKVPANNLPDFIADIRAAPGKYSYGGGHGSPPHLGGAWMSRIRQLTLAHIPYRGGAQAVNDVVGGHVDMFFGGVAASKPAIDSGFVKAFAVTGDERLAVLPDVPTFREAGVPEFELGSWTALLAPKGTPPEILAQLRRETAAVLHDAGVRRLLAAQGVAPGTAENVGTFLAKEHEKFGRVVRELGIAVER